ncbi:gag/pol protein [Cucumis melo var. makuwa]|uniref:Gag/pol protein n=1 Tax=Cucumis melo var. makuwa TaxID=1194695 RepID=A0A5D3DW10_CUCMM|nr:gag/pol protein [Cucumis melo var. makuwa]TYK27863.1 gag/pol protein [Cucumis melo var. makuwa]
MSDVLTKKHESLATTKEIMDSLKGMFGQPKWSLRHKTIKYIYTKRMKEGTSVRQHALDVMMHFNIAEVNGGAIDEANQLEDNSLPPCDSCLEGKMTKRSFTGKGLKAKNSLELVHSDLCGPMNVKARGGYEYFISFIDDYSRYGHVYLIQNKSDSFEKFKEYKAEVENEIDQPSEVRPIGCKWIYKRKQDQAGKEQTFKARLVAKGYTQKEGIDYEETFSPVAMIKSIRILLSIVTFYDYEIWQMDVKTTFLNGNLEENIYMVQLEGFIQKDQEQKNVDEPCIYKRIINSTIAFLVLYVDDILLIGNDVGHLTDIKEWLATQFQMKDLGNAQYVLAIQIVRNQKNKTLAMSQKSYIDKMLSRYKMQNSKKGLVPYKYRIHLSKEQCPKTPQEVEDMSNIPYVFAVGSLMYAMLCTRPDICYSVGIVSRYQSNLERDH